MDGLKGAPPGASGAAPILWRPSHAARAQAHELAHNPLYFTPDELAQHDGSSEDAMLLIAIRSSSNPVTASVLDVANGSEFYGPGNPYHCFTGKDASRAFSLMSLKAEHMHPDMQDASTEEWAVLDDWAKKLSAKYPSVGFLISGEEAPCADTASRDEWREV